LLVQAGGKMRVLLPLAGLMISCIQSPAVAFEAGFWPEEGRPVFDAAFEARSDYYSGRFPREYRRVTAGETIEYLQYRAEGACFVRVDGAVFEAEVCPLVQRALFEMAHEPTVDWWIRVVVEGDPRGWLRVEESAVREVGRLF
jgi:hypothetical protein